jgi:hypothetical protein
MTLVSKPVPMQCWVLCQQQVPPSSLVGWVEQPSTLNPNTSTLSSTGNLPVLPSHYQSLILSSSRLQCHAHASADDAHHDHGHDHCQPWAGRTHQASPCIHAGTTQGSRVKTQPPVTSRHATLALTACSLQGGMAVPQRGVARSDCSSSARLNMVATCRFHICALHTAMTKGS